MKPREFDELVRQKFDQNDFAYNPRSWDSLSEQLDGRAKKRSMFMWLWMPAVGMAASVALALGVTSLWQFGVPGAEQQNTSYVQSGKWADRKEQKPVAMIPYTTNTTDVTPQKQAKKIIRNTVKPVDKTPVTTVSLRLQNVLNTSVKTTNPGAVVVNSAVPKAVVPTAYKKEVAVRDREPLHTFRQDVHAPRKPINLSVILMGGVQQGQRNSGYMAGATIRKMINDKVYVESDVAFASSDNIQQTMYMDYSGGGSIPGSGGSGATAAKPSSAGKVSTTTADDHLPVDKGPVGVAKMRDVSYNLYYAQVSPSIGYKIIKRMSVAMGPDFQQMLVDNRPAKSEVDRGNLAVAPTFDVGFIGKTEYALTQRVKAGVSYRKGINGVINMSDKYIDRDYIQFQMRCTIFNR